MRVAEIVTAVAKALKVRRHASKSFPSPFQQFNIARHGRPSLTIGILLLKIADGELAFGGKSFIFAHDGDVAELTSFGPSDVHGSTKHRSAETTIIPRNFGTSSQQSFVILRKRNRSGVMLSPISQCVSGYRGNLLIRLCG
ncbi:hypothetical protein L596_011107 [Steinernema carpocapsae]|uniref:Uncharacterized protein n=1 Tax=Steinernema carpocapsae TaxID=34508 RepID=A0A4U5NTM3_STECR|nr:hypothetical protein L596_011107 [Steinernema carpocapsae]